MTTKQEIHDEISILLTEYETDDEDLDIPRTGSEWAEEFYNLLVKIQNNWEDVITADE